MGCEGGVNAVSLPWLPLFGAESGGCPAAYSGGISEVGPGLRSFHLPALLLESWRTKVI